MGESVLQGHELWAEDWSCVAGGAHAIPGSLSGSLE